MLWLRFKGRLIPTLEVRSLLFNADGDRDSYHDRDAD